MRDADKDRTPIKAWRRAKNDARTATRKLAEWARAQGQAAVAAEVEELAGRLAVLAAGLEARQSAADAREERAS